MLGQVVNQAYVDRNFSGVLNFGLIMLGLFTVKGLATYGHTVMLSRIGNRIIALNQRRVFEKLLNESLGFFSNRHSSEFISRLTTGAAAVTPYLIC